MQDDNKNDNFSGFLGRTPPSDVNAEMCVLGSMLISSDVIGDVTDVLQGEDFYKPAHQTIFDSIISLDARGERPDAITLVAELTKNNTLERVGGAPYIHDLVSIVPTAASAGFYANIVRRNAILYSVVQSGTRIVQMGYENDGSEIDDIVNKAQAEIMRVTENRVVDDYELVGEVVKTALDEIEAMASKKGDVDAIPTGIFELDKVLNKLHPGEMIVIAARPGLGKSTFALNIAREAALKKKKSTVLFSLEMSKSEIAMRLLSAEAGVELSTIRSGDIRGNWDKLGKTHINLIDAPLFIDESADNVSIVNIRSKARKLKQNNDLQLIIIDYLQLMSSAKRVESRQQEVSEFSRSLKLLAKELKVPVVVLSQLNRGPEQRTDKKPKLSDLRESGSIEQDADVVLLIHRDLDNADEMKAFQAEILVAKQRNGPMGVSIPVLFQGKFSRFGNPARQSEQSNEI
jgi:replicative DNA helicase